MTDRRRLPAARRAASVLARLHAGESQSQIARDMEISRQAISELVITWESQIVTRAEAAEALGYSLSSLATMMRRNPDRWPAPVGERTNREGRGKVYLYDLWALQAAAGFKAARSTRIGDAATISDDDGLLTCLECGRRFRGLGPHLRRVHEITGDEYRAAHGLPATAALSSDDTRRRSQEIGLERKEAGELAHLEPYQNAERMREITLGRGIDPSAESRDYESVRRNRRPGQERAVVRMVGARLEKLAQAARDHGYDGVEDAVTQTMHLPAKAAARATGLSAQTITRRRAARNAESPSQPDG